MSTRIVKAEPAFNEDHCTKKEMFVCSNTNGDLTIKTVGKYKPKEQRSSFSAPCHYDPYEIKDIIIQTPNGPLQSFFIVTPDGLGPITWSITALTDTYSNITSQNEVNQGREVVVYWS
jgi:hypothetical protein